ncbi:MAG: EAL domain-containing protein [Actinomycetia bacterium]|nr:EAL domain-containing protein [Actinomycetes bacterium]
MTPWVVHWQPIADLVTGQVVGYEALGRVAGREGEGFAAVRAAARGRGGLRRALHALQDHALTHSTDHPLGTHLCLNGRLDLLASLEKAVVSLPPGVAAGLVVEIPEHGGTLSAWDHGLASLRVRGVAVAVDDWGAGAADPLRLVRLRPEWIKLDVALVQQVGTSPEADRLVELLVRRTDPDVTRVIAEGVERPAQVWRLRALGVRFGQGFALAPPGPDRPARVPVPDPLEPLGDLDAPGLALSQLAGVTRADLARLADARTAVAAAAEAAARHTAAWIVRSAVAGPIHLQSDPDRFFGSCTATCWRFCGGRSTARTGSGRDALRPPTSATVWAGPGSRWRTAR